MIQKKKVFFLSQLEKKILITYNTNRSSRDI